MYTCRAIYSRYGITLSSGFSVLLSGWCCCRYLIARQILFLGVKEFMNLYLIKKVSQKQGKEPFNYVQLYADVGYTRLVLSFDKQVIAELLRVPVANLFDIPSDKPVLVGKFSLAEPKNLLGDKQ